MSTGLRHYSRLHPRRTAAIIFLCFVTALIGPLLLSGPSDTLTPSGTLTVDKMVIAVVWQTLLCVVLMGIVAWLGWHDIVALSGRIDRRGLIAFYVLLFILCVILGRLMLGMIGDGASVSPLRIVMIILSLNAMVGLSEELLFRGIIFGALRQKHRLITAIVASSLIFGVIHLTNLGAGQSLTVTLYQIVNAVTLGGLFCAIVLQTNSLWPAVILHMIWNSFVMLGVYTQSIRAPFSGGLSTAPTGVTYDIFVLPAVLLCVTAVMLWRFQKRTGQSIWLRPPVHHQVGA